jgi:hypothetical protein
MRKKFEFRKLSKVKEEAHDKEMVKNPDILKAEAVAETLTGESTYEVTKDTAHKPRGDREDQLIIDMVQLEEERLYLLTCMGTTHKLVADAAKT